MSRAGLYPKSPPVESKFVALPLAESTTSPRAAPIDVEELPSAGTCSSRSNICAEQRIGRRITDLSMIRAGSVVAPVLVFVEALEGVFEDVVGD
jgi:hypothetical protein